MRTFNSSGAKTLSYELVGDGPPVVMLPGGPGLSPEAFFAGVELDGFRQVILCPRGTGESDPPADPSGYRIGGYVSDLEDLRKHLDLSQLTLYGSSHGATIGLAYASAYPDHVDRMILASGPARMGPLFQQSLAEARERFQTLVADGAARLEAADTAFLEMRSESSESGRRAAMRRMMDVYIASPDVRTTSFLDRLGASPMNFTASGAMAAEMMGGLDLLQDAGQVRAHTLVLTGDLDVRVPSLHMEEIAQTIPDARVIRFASVGHLIHVEAREQWNKAVIDFLRAT